MKKQTVEQIVFIGGQMANLIYNLSQSTDVALREYRDMVPCWDAAVRRLREEERCRKGK